MAAKPSELSAEQWVTILVLAYLAVNWAIFVVLSFATEIVNCLTGRSIAQKHESEARDQWMLSANKARRWLKASVSASEELIQQAEAIF